MTIYVMHTVYGIVNTFADRVVLVGMIRGSGVLLYPKTFGISLTEVLPTQYPGPNVTFQADQTQKRHGQRGYEWW